MRNLATLPKAHLHVHLESTVRWDTLAEIATANGVPVPVSDEGSDEGSDGGSGGRFAGFRAFADRNSLVRQCLRRPGDFRRIAREFCAGEAAQGTRYAEVTFTAAAHGERLGDPAMPLLAVLEGLAEGRAEHGVECRVILDHSRRRSVERARRTLGLAVAHAGDGVVGIGVAGEESHSLAPFAEIFREAREAGVRVAHHAGEMEGPASIREALGPGRAERLGHGIRVLDDPDLVAEIRERGVALEVCPSSNVALGLVPSLAEHPLPRLREAGLTVTLNTDIPTATGATLTDEYARARAAFGYDDDVMADLARASVRASFAPPSVQARLEGEIDAWLASAGTP
ncbi:adenosine deaminase [Spongiactinospora sp. TRM90649]|uniref:adenosine deaminase n=1 Tax=Spongiactinospora sp. TRM90649 TaxID=3031114 RepID=UPI0023F8D4D1|nr:adenosine deaminase [Spongiactinospora sp. TRM90649]MDF5759134.1 adenosine deaminase [Spongiactinospora sp. TRM90649]